MTEIPSQGEIESDLRDWSRELRDRAYEYQALCDAAIVARHKADHVVTAEMLTLRDAYRRAGERAPSVDLLERQAVDVWRDEVLAADGAEAAVKASEKIQRAVSAGISAYQSLLNTVRRETS